MTFNAVFKNSNDLTPRIHNLWLADIFCTLLHHRTYITYITYPYLRQLSACNYCRRLHPSMVSVDFSDICFLLAHQSADDCAVWYDLWPMCAMNGCLRTITLAPGWSNFNFILQQDAWNDERSLVKARIIIFLFLLHSASTHLPMKYASQGCSFIREKKSGSKPVCISLSCKKITRPLTYESSLFASGVQSNSP